MATRITPTALRVSALMRRTRGGAVAHITRSDGTVGRDQRFMTVESCLLAAVNRTREQGVLSIIAAALNLALSIVLVQRFGSVGVIAGTILSYLLVLVVPQSLIVREMLIKPPDRIRRQGNQLPVTSNQ
jgi:hypothetical protein